MKLDEDKLHIKIVAIDVNYNFVIDSFDLKLLIVSKYYFKFSYFGI